MRMIFLLQNKTISSPPMYYREGKKVEKERFTREVSLRGGFMRKVQRWFGLVFELKKGLKSCISLRAKLLYEGKKLPTKDEQVWGYVFKLSIKVLVRKMMETKLTIGKSKACGFMRKAREARISTRSKGDGQN